MVSACFVAKSNNATEFHCCVKTTFVPVGSKEPERWEWSALSGSKPMGRSEVDPKSRKYSSPPAWTKIRHPSSCPCCCRGLGESVHAVKRATNVRPKKRTISSNLLVK